MEKRPFGTLPGGEQAFLYTISSGRLTAHISDFGATLVRLHMPDSRGELADVVLGFDDANAYRCSTTYFGATVGRNANRIKGASFSLGGETVRLNANDGCNNLHSGPDSYAFRLWDVTQYETDLIQFSLHSPDGDQGFPGNADIRVTYAFEGSDTLSITYEAVSDRDTVFNLTNHSYFNLAGHSRTELAMAQVLCMPSESFNPCDAESIPTGEIRSVAGTPMDFRIPKALGQDIDRDYECLLLQSGYDHNFQVSANPCAILCDPVSGRKLEISTDCPGIHLYSGNFFDGENGKDGISYCHRGGVALETQYCPDSVHHPEWPQPIVKAGTLYRSQTKYTFR